MKVEKKSMRHCTCIPVGFRPVFGAALMLLAALPWSLTPHAAQARIIACRADPIVTLSNGARVLMTVSIRADASRIRLITYTLHTPRGTSARNVMYTGSDAGLKETFHLLADTTGNIYISDTLVTATSSRIRTTATTAVSGIGFGAVSGFTGRHLVVHLWR